MKNSSSFWSSRFSLVGTEVVRPVLRMSYASTVKFRTLTFHQRDAGDESCTLPGTSPSKSALFFDSAQIHAQPRKRSKSPHIDLHVSKRSKGARIEHASSKTTRAWATTSTHCQDQSSNVRAWHHSFLLVLASTEPNEDKNLC